MQIGRLDASEIDISFNCCGFKSIGVALALDNLIRFPSELVVGSLLGATFGTFISDVCRRSLSIRLGSSSTHLVVYSILFVFIFSFFCICPLY
ncbi:hypothetical protein Y032_0490g2385 [Ancylostoma ceylanicum]|uniref:Uncharacterized protein n=1 Tax=Ancylostoma ceylanicum TaxID=53326 RepID=A0A016WWE5_9BILA|nr:hypothetical protein Y032_0490g2385 [Ancylostoma ceylanicum]